MGTATPAAVIREAPARTFVHVSRLPGTPVAARQAASRAARNGEIVSIRPGLYYRGAMTRYGMTRPRVEEVATEVFGDEGAGPAGYSAAREWGVTSQIPATFHVATLTKVATIEGITQHQRRNRKRSRLNPKEIALLELMRAPSVYVESGWESLVSIVEKALSATVIRLESLREAAVAEPRSVRENFERVLHDLGSE